MEMPTITAELYDVQLDVAFRMARQTDHGNWIISLGHDDAAVVHGNC